MRNLLEAGENVALFAISIDDAEKSKVMMQKVAKDGKGEIKYSLLSDPLHKTIDEYGILDARYIGKGVEGIPQTAIYILDEKRKIVWANVNPDYANRPSLETLRKELDKFKEKSETDKKQL